MKKIRALSLFIIVCLIFNLFNALASDNIEDINSDSTSKISSANIDEYCQTNLIVSKTENNVIKKSINEGDLEEFKNILSKQGKTKSESNKYILESLGYTDTDINNIGQERIDKIFDQAHSISISEQYMKVNADGSSTIMNKEQCIKEAEELNKTKQKKQIDQNDTKNIISSNNMVADVHSNDGWSDVTEQTGYMRILTEATYIGTQANKGRYIYSGTFMWLTLPNFRMVDAISLGTLNGAWLNNDYGNYYSTMSYNITLPDGSIDHISEVKTTDNSVQGNGVYFKWQLPKDDYEYAYNNIPVSIHELYFYMEGKGTVEHPNEETTFDLFSNYTHVYSTINFQPTFQWQLGSKPVVGVNGSMAYATTPYNSLCWIDYQPNCYK